MFIFIFFGLMYMLALNDVNAQRVSNITWDRLFMYVMTELKGYIYKANEDYTSNNLTAIHIDSENILSSSSFKNISA